MDEFVNSEFKQYKFIINTTTSYGTAQVSDYLPTGIDNQKFYKDNYVK